MNTMMQKGFNNLPQQQYYNNNEATGTLVGGFVAGVSVTLALVRLFTK